MKQLLKHIGACCAGLVVSWCLSAQPNLARVEYYLDKDPGYGKGTAVSFTAGKSLTDIALNFNPSGLSAGIHILGLRVKDANNAWSPDNIWLFAKPFPDPAGGGTAPNLTNVEYYMDIDPGYGKATPVTFTPGTSLSDIAINIDPAALSAGIHLFGIRSKDAKGAWSPDNKWLFAKPFPDPAGGGTPNLTKVEYYLDTDPGYGKATPVSFTPGTSLSDIAINIDTASLSPGIHLFGIRVKDAKNAWSQDNKWLFVKPYPDVADSGTAPNLTNVEYYLDVDPGYGLATPISFTAGISLSDIPVNIDPASLTQGLHIFGIRLKDAKGAWSQDSKWLFAKPYAAVSTTIPKISHVEYYIDTDPGYGKGVPVAIKDSTSLSDIDLAINITGLLEGTHFLYIRTKGANKAWSLDNVFEFNLGAETIESSIVLNSFSRKTVCPPDTFKIAYQKKGTFNAGNIFNVQMSDASGSFVSPIVVGSYTGTTHSIITCAIPAGLPGSSRYRLRIVSTSPVVTGLPSVDSITVKTTHPVPTITPAGTVNLCTGNSTSLTASNGFITYLWSSGQTSKQISVSTAGNYKVSVIDSAGCTGTSATDTVKIIKIPDTTSKIAGPTQVAPLQSNITFSVTNIPGLVYTWAVPVGDTITSGQGTASIKVKWGTSPGKVTVTASNQCGTSPVRELAVTIITPPIATNRPFSPSLKEEEGLYPNPASSTATVVFSADKADDYFIEITDIAGKRLFIKSGTSLYGINKVALDVSKFSNGMYIINLKDKQRTVRSMKLNKQGF